MLLVGCLPVERTMARMIVVMVWLQVAHPVPKRQSASAQLAPPSSQWGQTVIAQAARR